MESHIYFQRMAVLDSFCCQCNCIMKMVFAVKLVYNKVVDNLLILLMLNFHVNRPNGL
jgi:hypothetical protein